MFFVVEFYPTQEFHTIVHWSDNEHSNVLLTAWLLCLNNAAELGDIKNYMIFKYIVLSLNLYHS